MDNGWVYPQYNFDSVCFVVPLFLAPVGYSDPLSNFRLSNPLPTPSLFPLCLSEALSLDTGTREASLQI